MATKSPGGAGGGADVLRHREFANPRTQAAETIACCNRIVVVAGHRQAGGTRGGGDPVERGGNGIGAGGDLVGQRLELGHFHAGAAGVFRALHRVVQLAQD